MSQLLLKRNLSDEVNEFEQGDSGCSANTYVEAGRRKIGSLLLMKGKFPCKVTQLTTAAPGKHGAAKAMIVAKDIFTENKYEETFSVSDMVQAPNVSKIEYVCSYCDDEGVLYLINEQGECREDISLPVETHLASLGQTIKEIIEKGSKECLVTVQFWGTRHQPISVREGNQI